MIRAMENQQQVPWTVLAITVAFALTMAVWPMPGWAVWLRPEFAAMTVVYWVLSIPFRLGMFFAWCLGLAIDVLQGVMLGQNALGLTVLAYLGFLLHQRLRMFSLFEQASAVFVLVGIYQLIGYWVHGLTGGGNHSLAFLIPALVSAIVWPMYKLVVDRLRM